MAIIAHPNKHNVERYRVFDRKLEIQEYFSVKQLGMKKAKAAALARQAEIDNIKAIQKLKSELPLLQIFDEDGKVKGLTKVIIQRKDRQDVESLVIQINVSYKVRKKRSISLGSRSFEEAYQLAQDYILELRGLERTREINAAFKRAKRHYW